MNIIQESQKNLKNSFCKIIIAEMKKQGVNQLLGTSEDFYINDPDSFSGKMGKFHSVELKEDGELLFKTVSLSNDDGDELNCYTAHDLEISDIGNVVMELVEESKINSNCCLTGIDEKTDIVGFIVGLHDYITIDEKTNIVGLYDYITITNGAINTNYSDYINKNNLDAVLKHNSIEKPQYEIFDDRVVLWKKRDSYHWLEWDKELSFSDPNWVNELVEFFGKLEPLQSNCEEVFTWWNANYGMYKEKSCPDLMLIESDDSYQLRSKLNTSHVFAQVFKHLSIDEVKNKLSALVEIYR